MHFCDISPLNSLVALTYTGQISPTKVSRCRTKIDPQSLKTVSTIVYGLAGTVSYFLIFIFNHNELKDYF